MISSPFCTATSRERAMSLHLVMVFTLAVHCLQREANKILAADCRSLSIHKPQKCP